MPQYNDNEPNDYSGLGGKIVWRATAGPSWLRRVQSEWESVKHGWVSSFGIDKRSKFYSFFSKSDPNAILETDTGPLDFELFIEDLKINSIYSDLIQKGFMGWSKDRHASLLERIDERIDLVPPHRQTSFLKHLMMGLVGIAADNLNPLFWRRDLQRVGTSSIKFQRHFGGIEECVQKLGIGSDLIMREARKEYGRELLRGDCDKRKLLAACVGTHSAEAIAKYFLKDDTLIARAAKDRFNTALLGTLDYDLKLYEKSGEATNRTFLIQYMSEYISREREMSGALSEKYMRERGKRCLDIYNQITRRRARLKEELHSRKKQFAKEE